MRLAYVEKQASNQNRKRGQRREQEQKDLDVIYAA
jgi:hypothetical protein